MVSCAGVLGCELSELWADTVGSHSGHAAGGALLGWGASSPPADAIPVTHRLSTLPAGEVRTGLLAAGGHEPPPPPSRRSASHLIPHD